MRFVEQAFDMLYAYTTSEQGDLTVAQTRQLSRVVRAKLGASQAEFALMIGVSVATLRNWGQGRRTPDGPALALVRVASRNPKAVIQALHTEPKRGA